MDGTLLSGELSKMYFTKIWTPTSRDIVELYTANSQGSWLQVHHVFLAKFPSGCARENNSRLCFLQTNLTENLKDLAFQQVALNQTACQTDFVSSQPFLYKEIQRQGKSIKYYNTIERWIIQEENRVVLPFFFLFFFKPLQGILRKLEGLYVLSPIRYNI